MDWWLVLLCVVGSILVLVINIYLLIHYQSPEDHNQAWIPKIVVVSGLSFAFFIILLLPLDVGNRSGGGLQLEALWQFILMAVAVLGFIVIPFCMFYYEEQDPDSGVKTQWMGALKMTSMMVIVVVLTVAIGYVFLGKTQIPATQYQAKWSTTGVCVSGTAGTNKGCDGEGVQVVVRVSIVIFIVAVESFFGWFLFALFGGVGLIALPMDLINGFRTRPRPMDSAERARWKVELQGRATTLISVGKGLDEQRRKGDGKGRKYRRNLLAYKQAVYFLEGEFEKLRLVEKEGGGSPVKWAVTLAMGVVGALLSLLWVLHIILYSVISPPAASFLNGYFVALDSFFPLFGTVSYGIFAFYILWAVMKGNMKFGLRLLCIAIHPMKIGDTLMNSFLFNVGLILFSSVSVVQFCAQTFNQYARLTAVGSLFGTYVRYLMGLSYFWTYYLYGLLGMAFLMLIYLVFWPKDKSKEEELDLELIHLKGGARV
jgi:LMBR1 domain-containing protein 1